MPVKPLKLCQHRNCREWSNQTYCDKHRPIVDDSYRANSYQRGYDAQWKKARLIFLKENPLCVHCEVKGIIKPAKEVDHIIPHKGNYNLFWDKSNWQALCKRCHSYKTATEDSTFAKKINTTEWFR